MRWVGRCSCRALASVNTIHLSSRNIAPLRRLSTTPTSSSSSSSLSSANLVVYLGAVCNLGLAASKGYIGTAIGSSALVADAASSLGDLLSDAVVYYSLNAARRGTTENNPWGSGKLEPLGAFSVGILLLGTGGGVGFSVICSLMEIISSGGAEETIAAVLPTSSSLLGTDPHKASELFEAGSLITYAAIGISLTSMITKEALYHITLHAGKRSQSDAVIANAYQHRADVLLSGAVLCGISGSMLGYPLLDPLAGLLVSGVIVYQGTVTVIDAVKDLIDSPASPKETKILSDTCLSVPGVQSVVSLKARKSGPFLFIEAVLGVNGNMSASAAHRVAELSRRALLDKHPGRVANAIVHIDPLGASGMGQLAPVVLREHKQVTHTIETLLQPVKEITSVSEVQLYYHDDGRIKIKVDVCMASELTIAEAHLVAKKAETVIAEALIWAKSIDVDLELHGSSGSSTSNSTFIGDATPSTLNPSNSKPLSTVSTNSSAVERDGVPLQKSVNVKDGSPLIDESAMAR